MKILISGNYGVNNLGDEAILSGLLKIINSAFKNPDIVVLSSNINFTKKSHRVNSEQMFSAGIKSFLKNLFTLRIFKQIKLLLSCDLFVLGGGGLFNDEEKGAVWIWFCQTIWPIIFRKKLVLLGQSIGPIKSNFNLFIAKIIFKNSLLITVRDDVSFNFLKNLKIQNAVLNTDLALANRIKPAENFHKKNQIILSLRNWKNFTEDKLCEIANFIDYIYEQKKLVTIFIPFQVKNSNDLIIADKISRLIKKPNSFRIFEGEMNFLKIIDEIKSSKAVLGMRLHSIIFAMMSRTLVLPISYSKKVEGFCKSVGLNNFLKLEEITEQKLIKNFENLKTDFQEIDLKEKQILEQIELLRKLF